jgi:uncharacterized membrane protein YedE/YeeE
VGELWPWWLGAIALASVGLAFYVFSGKLLGVSGMLGRMVDPREPELDSLQAAMIAETIAQFGPQPGGVDGPAEPAPLSFTAQLTFLLMLFAGGLLGQLTMGGWSIRTTLGETFDRLWGTGGLSFAVLGVGGVLVGFGTRMAGGCTSGHGLSGCSRLQPGSLAATATFLGTAIGVSLLVAAVFG